MTTPAPSLAVELREFLAVVDDLERRHPGSAGHYLERQRFVPLRAALATHDAQAVVLYDRILDAVLAWMSDVGYGDDMHAEDFAGDAQGLAGMIERALATPPTKESPDGK